MKFHTHENRSRFPQNVGVNENWPKYEAQYKKHEEFKEFLDRTSVGAPPICCRQRYPDWYATVVHFAVCHLLCYYHAKRWSNPVNPENTTDRYYFSTPELREIEEDYLRLHKLAKHALYTCIPVRAQDAEGAYQAYPALKTFFLSPAV